MFAMRNARRFSRQWRMRRDDIGDTSGATSRQSGEASPVRMPHRSEFSGRSRRRLFGSLPSLSGFRAVQNWTLGPANAGRDAHAASLGTYGAGGVRVPGRFIDVDGDLIASVLGLLARSFDHLIIDLPRTWHPWTDNVIWGSDRIFVVSGFTIPALRQARLLADAISAKASLEANVSVLVNKFHEPLIGPGLSRKDAETMLSTRLANSYRILAVSWTTRSIAECRFPRSELETRSRRSFCRFSRATIARKTHREDRSGRC